MPMLDEDIVRERIETHDDVIREKRLPGVGHTKASEEYPEEYYRRVIGFFERNLA